MARSPETTIDAATAREIAMRSGAARVIFVSVTGSHGHYSLDVDLQQPANTPDRYRAHWSNRFSWQAANAPAAAGTIPAELLNSVHAASDWIRHEVGESANDIARLDAPPEDVTTDRWEALAAYTDAVKLNHDHRPLDAIVALRLAIAIDPRFALAYSFMADIELTVHHEEEGFEAYKRALNPDLERRLSRRERDRIEGMYALDSGDYPTAVDAFRDYQTFYPNDPLAWLYSPPALTYLGRGDEAIANLKHAILLDPTSTYALNALASQYVAKDDLNTARQTLAKIGSSAKSAATTAINGEIAFLDRQYDQAFNLFYALETSPEPRLRSRGFEMLADLFAERGYYALAIKHFDQGIAEDAAQGNLAAQASKLADRASMKARLKDFSGCAADLNAALATDPSPQLFFTVETILGQAIQTAPPSALPELRKQMIALSHELPHADYGVITHQLTMRTQAEAALAAGNTNAALKQFQNLAAIDAPALPHEYLARGLAASAAIEPNPAKALELRTQAEQRYADIAFHPGMIWTNSFSYPPGLVADALQSYLQLAERVGDHSTTVTEAQARFAGLHPTIRLPSTPLN